MKNRKSDKGVQGWGQLVHGQQHFVPAQRVECALEIQLHNLVVVVEITGIHPSCVDCFYNPHDAKPKLPWCQERDQLLSHFGLNSQVAEGAAHHNRANPPVHLEESSQVGAKEVGPNGRWSSAFQYQLHGGNNCRE